VLVSASMDLHGNVSHRLARSLDLITCYRKAPHTDAWETRERAVRNLVSRLRDGGKPLKAWVQVPVLLPGEKTSTRIDPARSVYALVDEVEALPGVLDAAIWVGYAWADEPRCQAAIVVTGDDRSVIEAQAARLAQAYWDARHDFAFVAPTGSLGECVAQALASPARPFFISDSGDNPTAGGAGDVPYLLDRLLRRGSFRSAIYAAITDPAAVRACTSVGSEVEVSLGGRLDPRYGQPLRVTGRVLALVDDDAVLACGGVRVIVTSRRKPFHRIADFSRLGLDPTTADLVVVKIGYLEPELYAMRADWIMALTPGGVDQDIEHLPYKRIQRPMFPMDKDMKEPDLSARLIPFAD